MAEIHLNEDDLNEHISRVEAIKKPYYEALEKYKALKLRELYDKTIADIEVAHSDFVCNHIELLLDHDSYSIIKDNDFKLDKPEFWDVIFVSLNKSIKEE